MVEDQLRQPIKVDTTLMAPSQFDLSLISHEEALYGKGNTGCFTRVYGGMV